MISSIIEIVQECGDILIQAEDMEDKVYQKEGKANYVTAYDSQIQEILKRKLLGILPEASFMGEENDADKVNIDKGFSFIVDPIDGTTNFMRDYRASCISVALTENGKPIMGVIYNPYLYETFYCEKGKGAFLNGKPISTSENELSEALVLFGTSPYNTTLAQKSFEVAYRYFEKATDLRRSGSAAIDLCYVACGRADLFFELQLLPWDYAAGALLVEEAGGIVSDLEGNDITYNHSQTIVARAPKVELLK